MKITIENNSIKFRLTDKDISKLVKKGKVTQECNFGPSSSFKYTVKANKKANSKNLYIDLSPNHIKIEINPKDVKSWKKGDLIGYDAEMDNGTKSSLYVLLEKDLKKKKK
ncbi:MAG: hypothetical protein V3V14_06825 [Saprospiraceae bacterium]